MSDDVEHRHAIVSQRLRDRRRELGLTQKQVVTRLGRLGVYTSNKALSCQEHGSGLDVAKLPDLALALDCTTTYLLGLTAEPHRWDPDPADAPGGTRPTDQAEGGMPTPATRPAVSAAQVTRRATWILGPNIPARPPHSRNGTSASAHTDHPHH